MALGGAMTAVGVGMAGLAKEAVSSAITAETEWNRFGAAVNSTGGNWEQQSTEIKKWVKEEYNVSVSSLYIAQCKDACGFEKRENYNTGAEGHKVPNCPAEKRELIMKAFKHFKMI